MRVTPAGVGKFTGPRNQRHMAAGFARGCGDGKTHLSGAAIREVAHRVETLARGAGRDQHIKARQQPGIGRRFEQAGCKQVGFPHAPGADLTARLVAGRGAEKAYAARDQRGDVRLRRLVGPHDAIHGGSDDDGRLGREAKRRQQIVGASACQTRDQVRTCGRDEHELGPACELDVAHGRFRALIPEVGAYGTTRHRLECHGRHEFPRGLSHDDLYLGAALDQPAHQIGTLVGRNASGHSQQNTGLGRQWMPLSSLKRAMSPSNC